MNTTNLNEENNTETGLNTAGQVERCVIYHPWNGLKPGKYLYKMPHWNDWKNVSIEDSKAVLLMRHKNGYYPCSIKNLPFEAVLKEDV